MEQKTIDSQFIIGVGGNDVLNIDREGSMIKDMDHKTDLPTVEPIDAPTEEERKTLRKVAGKLPLVAYYICAVEFAERASYYGVQPLFQQYVNRPLPAGGNGFGAPKRGTQDTAGALGLGSVKATAVSQSFSMLTYSLPLFFGWLADTKTGRFSLITWGVVVCGVAHVLMCAAGAPSLLANGGAKGPFFVSIYLLAIGAAMFKPNISPTLLDQMTNQVPQVTTLKSGERVILDPEATTERVMLWFYLLINVGAFMNVPTSFTEKYVGWWLSFLLPLILYMPLLPLLYFLKDKLVLVPPGGSDLGNIFRILGICFKNGGIRRIFTKNCSFFDPATPSFRRANGIEGQLAWNDEFVEDVKRTFQAAGIFCFFPFQAINDQGLGGTANTLSTMLTTNGVPNDVIGNFNSLCIICFAPILNYGLYPLLRRYNIHYGPVARITTGLLLAAIGGAGYTLICWKGYQLSPCGNHGTQCFDASGNSLVAPITIWWMAIPYALGGLSELFVNVPAYGIAYSRAPKNMRGFLSALNLFMQAVTYAIGLATASIVRDPFLTWDFGGPVIIGLVATAVFYWIYHDIDKEEYRLSRNEAIYRPDEHEHEHEQQSGEENEKPLAIDEKKNEDEIAESDNTPPATGTEKEKEKEIS